MPLAEEVGDVREDWMRHADQVLADEQMVAAVYEALGKRHPKSRWHERAKDSPAGTGMGMQASRVGNANPRLSGHADYRIILLHDEILTYFGLGNRSNEADRCCSCRLTASLAAR